MKIQDIDDPIAEREFSMGEDKVLIRFGRPQSIEDGGDYYCPYSIQSGKYNKMSYAVGIDSVQAIQLAMQRVSIDLKELEKNTGLPISWLDMTGLGL